MRQKNNLVFTSLTFTNLRLPLRHHSSKSSLVPRSCFCFCLRFWCLEKEEGESDDSGRQERAAEFSSVDLSLALLSTSPASILSLSPPLTSIDLGSLIRPTPLDLGTFPRDLAHRGHFQERSIKASHSNSGPASSVRSPGGLRRLQTSRNPHSGPRPNPGRDAGTPTPGPTLGRRRPDAPGRPKPGSPPPPPPPLTLSDPPERGRPRGQSLAAAARAPSSSSSRLALVGNSGDRSSSSTFFVFVVFAF